MSEQIPIPSQAIQISQKLKAASAVQKLQLENVLLKHLVATIDPEHDYHMDLDNMTLTKVKKDGKAVQSSLSEEDPNRGSSAPGGETGGPAQGDLRGLKPAAT